MSFDELERRTAEVARNRENRARWANAYARFRSEGQGSFEFHEPAEFGLTFLELPFVSIGHQVDTDAVEDMLEAPVAPLPRGESPPLPQVTGYVTEWEQDDRGYYTGAYCAVSVAYPMQNTLNELDIVEYLPLIPVEAQVEIFHYFTFSAVAMKDIPTQTDEEAD